MIGSCNAMLSSALAETKKVDADPAGQSSGDVVMQGGVRETKDDCSESWLVRSVEAEVVTDLYEVSPVGHLFR